MTVAKIMAPVALAAALLSGCSFLAGLLTSQEDFTVGTVHVNVDGSENPLSVSVQFNHTNKVSISNVGYKLTLTKNGTVDANSQPWIYASSISFSEHSDETVVLSWTSDIEPVIQLYSSQFAGVARGSYYVGASINFDGAVEESNIDNNTGVSDDTFVFTPPS
jgi:hypothetical protein